MADISPVLNAVLICVPNAVNEPPVNLFKAIKPVEASLSPPTTPIIPNNFFSASSIAEESAPNAINSDEAAPTAPTTPLNASAIAVPRCSASKASNCNSIFLIRAETF